MRFTKLLLAATAFAATAPAVAQTVDSDTMTVTANINNSCNIYTPGTIDVSGGNFQAGFSQSSAIGVWCTNGFTVNLTSTSANSGKLVGAGDPTNQITYGLTGLASSFTGTAGTFPVGVPFTLVFPASNPKADNYSDVVTFTLST